MWTKTGDQRSPCHIQSPQSEEQANHGPSLFVPYNGQAAERPASVLVTDAVALMCVRVCSGFLFLFCSVFLGKYRSLLQPLGQPAWQMEKPGRGWGPDAEGECGWRWNADLLCASLLQLKVSGRLELPKPEAHS